MTDVSGGGRVQYHKSSLEKGDRAGQMLLVEREGEGVRAPRARGCVGWRGSRAASWPSQVASNTRAAEAAYTGQMGRLLPAASPLLGAACCLGVVARLAKVAHRLEPPKYRARRPENRSRLAGNRRGHLKTAKTTIRLPAQATCCSIKATRGNDRSVATKGLVT